MKLQPSRDDYVQDLAVVHSCSHLSTYPSQSNHCCLQVLTNVCILVQGFISLWCYFRPLSGVGQVSFCAHYLKVQQPPYQHGTVRVHCLLYLQNLSMYDKFPCYVGSNIQKTRSDMPDLPNSTDQLSQCSKNADCRCKSCFLSSTPEKQWRMVSRSWRQTSLHHHLVITESTGN